jgi:hypothetical protein
MKYGVTANVLSPGARTRMVGTIPDPARMRGDDGDGDGDGEARAARMDADQVAPAVIYVASVRSGWLTGQVFGAQGTSISLYNRPRKIREIVTTGGIWELDDLFATFEEAFRPAVDDTENFYEQVAKADTAKALTVTRDAAVAS